MADGVGESDVRHVAALARIGLDAAQVAKLVRELNGILAHMDVLARVDTSRTPPFVAERLAAMPLRPDERAAGASMQLGAIAPQMRDGFFLVPRLATHEDDAS
jgi:aspartyl-tRNA(Asn)/glutamyl-tRNA(Gln) amidotransferase subunit C